MNKLKGTGIPTRKTAGAIGDIYTDTATGKQYKCVFSYRENTTGEFDCQWKPINPEQSKAVDVKNPEQSKAIGETEVKKTIEPKPESPKETPKKPAGKTNYAAAFNKK